MTKTAKTKKPKTCRCTDKVDEALAAQGARLCVTISLRGGPERAIIATERRTPRVKLHRLIASYCPFCGTKYPESKGGPNLVL